MDVTLAKIEEIENHFIAWTSSVLVPGHVVMRMWWYVPSPEQGGWCWPSLQ